MRSKTQYVHIPDAYEISYYSEWQSIIFLRENIRICGQDEYGNDRYEADEYSLIIPTSATLPARVAADFGRWMALAKAEDYAAAAAKVREKRDRLLAESDERMCLDRMNLQRPNGVLFTDWLGFFRNLADVLSGSWARYRQTLRDLPQQPGFPYDVNFPEKPK